MNERKGPSSVGVGTVNERKFAMFLLTRAVEIPEAVVRFMGGPAHDGAGAVQPKGGRSAKQDRLVEASLIYRLAVLQSPCAPSRG